MAALPGVSMRRVCRILSFSRARLRARAVVTAASPIVDKALAERIQRLIGVASDPWLPAAVANAALRRRRPYQSQSRVSSAETEGLVCQSARDDAAAAGSRIEEPGATQQTSAGQWT